jgi:hypothetical protein
MIRVWNVKIRLLDAIGKKVCEATVDCMDLNPGTACSSAFDSHDDIRRAATKPEVHAVQFLVIAKKGAKK